VPADLAVREHELHVRPLRTGDDRHRDTGGGEPRHQCTGVRSDRRLGPHQLPVPPAPLREQRLDQCWVPGALGHHPLDDLAIAVAGQPRDVVLRRHLPAQVLGEQLGEDLPQDRLVVGQRAVEVEDHTTIRTSRPGAQDPRQVLHPAETNRSSKLDLDV